jgi:hypothetical protein
VQICCKKRLECHAAAVAATRIHFTVYSTAAWLRRDDGADKALCDCTVCCHTAATLLLRPHGLAGCYSVSYDQENIVRIQYMYCCARQLSSGYGQSERLSLAVERRTQQGQVLKYVCVALICSLLQARVVSTP